MSNNNNNERAEQRSVSNINNDDQRRRRDEYTSSDETMTTTTSQATKTSSLQHPSRTPPHNNNNNNNNLVPPLPLPKLHDRIIVFQSSPLVWKSHNKVYPLEPLDFDYERKLLIDSLNDAKEKIGSNIEIEFECATMDRLGAALTFDRSPIIHFSGHGHPDYLALENENEWGSMQSLKVKQLKSFVSAGSSGGNLQVVFVSACHSRKAGEAFIEAGVKHVVCCPQESDRVRHSASTIFARNFYRSLSCPGKTLQDSFQFACQAVLLSPHVRKAKDEVKKFVLLPEKSIDDPYHNIQVFYNRRPNQQQQQQGQFSSSSSSSSSSSTAITCSLSNSSNSSSSSSSGPNDIHFQCSNNNSTTNRILPPPPPAFGGQGEEMYHILNEIRENRLIQITSATKGQQQEQKKDGNNDNVMLGRSVCNYIHNRQRVFFIEDVIWIDVLQQQGETSFNNNNEDDYYYNEDDMDDICTYFQRILYVLLVTLANNNGSDIDDSDIIADEYHECYSRIIKSLHQTRSILFVNATRIKSSCCMQKIRTLLGKISNETHHVKFVLICPSSDSNDDNHQNFDGNNSKNNSSNNSNSNDKITSPNSSNKSILPPTIRIDRNNKETQSRICDRASTPLVLRRRTPSRSYSNISRGDDSSDFDNDRYSSRNHDRSSYLTNHVMCKSCHIHKRTKQQRQRWWRRPLYLFLSTLFALYVLVQLALMYNLQQQLWNISGSVMSSTLTSSSLANQITTGSQIYDGSPSCHRLRSNADPSKRCIQYFPMVDLNDADDYDDDDNRLSIADIKQHTKNGHNNKSNMLTTAILTKRGIGHSHDIANQDRSFVIAPYLYTNNNINKSTNNNPSSILKISQKNNDFLMCVCDGHGVDGHVISEYVAQKIPPTLTQNLLQEETNEEDPTRGGQETIITNAIRRTFVQLDLQSVVKDHKFSGTTLSLALKLNNDLFVANVGDSQTFIVAVYYKKNKKQQHLQQQYEEGKDKYESTTGRALKSEGGSLRYRNRVFMNNQPREEGEEDDTSQSADNDSYRVVVTYPKSDSNVTLAFSRSIGDSIAKRYQGVSAEPIISKISLDTIKNDKRDEENLVDLYCISATDGLIDKIPQEQLISQFVATASSNGLLLSSQEQQKQTMLLYQTIEDIILYATKIWKASHDQQILEPYYRDDITLAVTKIKL